MLVQLMKTCSRGDVFFFDDVLMSEEDHMGTGLCFVRTTNQKHQKMGYKSREAGLHSVYLSSLYHTGKV